MAHKRGLKKTTRRQWHCLRVVFFNPLFFMWIFGNWRPATSKPYSPNLIHKALNFYVVVDLFECWFLKSNLPLQKLFFLLELVAINQSRFLTLCRIPLFFWMLDGHRQAQSNIYLSIYQESLKLSFSWTSVKFLLGSFESFWVFEINHKSIIFPDIDWRVEWLQYLFAAISRLQTAHSIRNRRVPSLWLTGPWPLTF